MWGIVLWCWMLLCAVYIPAISISAVSLRLLGSGWYSAIGVRPANLEDLSQTGVNESLNSLDGCHCCPQVSDPYSKTDLTLVLNCRTLVFRDSSFELQMFFSCTNTALALPCRFLLLHRRLYHLACRRHCPSRWRLLLLPGPALPTWWGECCPHSLSGPLSSPFRCSVQVVHRWSPHHLSSLASSAECGWVRRARSSAKSMSSSCVHRLHWIPFRLHAVDVFMVQSIASPVWPQSSPQQSLWSVPRVPPSCRSFPRWRSWWCWSACPECLPVEAVERLFALDKIDEQRWVHSKDCSRMIRSVAIWLTQDLCFLKPACWSLSWVSTTSFILFRTILLNTFPGMDRSVIPR